MSDNRIEAAVAAFRKLAEEQAARAEAIKQQGAFKDYTKLDKITIGVCGGDGIGPIITKESANVLKYILKDEVESGRIVFKDIDGLTIENRVAQMKAIPDDVLEELKNIDVGNMTPIDALNTIYRLQNKLKNRW